MILTVCKYLNSIVVKDRGYYGNFILFIGKDDSECITSAYDCKITHNAGVKQLKFIKEYFSCL